jgi:UDP-N-acetyl-D-mannosaminuronic acid transferase (WecB/TagA/CpsF family)
LLSRFRVERLGGNEDAMMRWDDTRVLGIWFYGGSLDHLLDRSVAAGMIVAPSAPILADLSDEAHWEAMAAADVVIVDSGFLVLLWKAFKGRRLQRISGLGFLRGLVLREEFRRPGESFWVMPSEVDARATVKWLEGQGIALGENDWCVAPSYPRGPLADRELLSAIEWRHPAFVVINLGGGVQERLGHFLKDALSWRPTIVCTGAAIAFLSGRQTRIPPWADRLFLGWFLRIANNPMRFFPRYWKAIRLGRLVWKNGANSPLPGGAWPAAQ